MELKLNKSNWTKVNFSDVVEKISNRINPEEYHSAIVIEGGDINKRDFHIRSYSNKNELGYLGPAFHMGFKKGNILYVSRNPHLMKVGYAQFDGICANTTFLMQTIDEVVLRNDLIPFFMLSDTFIEQSVTNVRGGVNPYVNWGDIACIEFLLPPKKEQDKIAELLWSLDELIEKDISLLEKNKNTLKTSVEKEIHSLDLDGKTIEEVLEELSKKTKLVSLTDLGEFFKGRGIQKKDVKENGIPCLRYGELYTKHHTIIRKFGSFISEIDKSNSVLLKKNDVVFAGSGETISEIGKSAAFVSDIEAYAGGDTLIFRPKEMDGYYLGYLMNSQIVRQQLNKYGTGSTVMHIYVSDLTKVKVPEVPKKKQIEISQRLEGIYKNIKKIEAKISSSKMLQISILNQVF